LFLDREPVDPQPAFAAANRPALDDAGRLAREVIPGGSAADATLPRGGPTVGIGAHDARH